MREAAAKRLIANHDAVLYDVTHPKPLTQANLARLSEKARPYVDEVLREVTRRLLGRRPGSSELEVRIDPSNRAQGTAWIGTVQYLEARIQANPDEKPG